MMMIQSFSTVCERGDSKQIVVSRSGSCVVRRSGFFNEFLLFEVGLVTSKRFSPWRYQTRSGFLVRSRVQRPEPTGPASDSKQPPKNHVGHTGNHSGKTTSALLPPRRILCRIDCSSHVQSEYVEQTRPNSVQSEI